MGVAGVALSVGILGFGMFVFSGLPVAPEIPWSALFSLSFLLSFLNEVYTISNYTERLDPGHSFANSYYPTGGSQSLVPFPEHRIVSYNNLARVLSAEMASLDVFIKEKSLDQKAGKTIYAVLLNRNELFQKLSSVTKEVKLTCKS